ncbi:GNAT family N-acetyltransferase [Huintestinicola sp.]|uniref:GNAT family N-acetyltransferase n=1 Tax=Huintestinicola sp. TaxID=2981661 RepID=UPI003D7D0246
MRLIMKTQLKRITAREAETLWKMQVEAFQELYEKYQDTETSPATEPIDKILMKINQPFTYFYFIEEDNTKVGAIRVVDEKESGKPKRIAPVFVMPEYRNKGYAQKAIQLAEEIHGDSCWELDTILQEKGNCHLYEKLGYRTFIFVMLEFCLSIIKYFKC